MIAPGKRARATATEKSASSRPASRKQQSGAKPGARRKKKASRGSPAAAKKTRVAGKAAAKKPSAKKPSAKKTAAKKTAAKKTAAKQTAAKKTAAKQTAAKKTAAKKTAAKKTAAKETAARVGRASPARAARSLRAAARAQADPHALELRPFRIVHHGGGRASVCLDALDDRTFAVLDARGMRSTGSTIDAIASALLRERAPDVAAVVRSASEVAMFVLVGPDAAIRRAAVLLAATFADAAALTQAALRANPDLVDAQ